MWPLWDRRNMTRWSAVAGGIHHTHKANTMESIDPNFTWKEIQGLYQEVYQLQRLPGGSHCKGATEEWLWEEIQASIRECFWLGIPPENEGEHPSSTPSQRDSWTEYHDSIHRTHKNSQPESRAETMRCWPLPWMPTKKPWLQPLSWRRGLKGWTVLPADTTPETAGTPEAIDILAVGTQDPKCTKKGNPGWCLSKLTLTQKLAPLVASHHRGMHSGRDWSSSPVRQKCWVTFALEKVPSPAEPLESYDRGDEAYKCLLHTWPARKGPPDSTDWSTPAEEGKVFPAKDLESPPPLEPFMQELLEEVSCTNAGMDSGMLPPSWPMLGDPGPSLMEHEHWIKLHTWYIDMPDGGANWRWSPTWMTSRSSPGGWGTLSKWPRWYARCWE